MNPSGIYELDWLDLSWSNWKSIRPTEDAISGLSNDPGLYRVRHDQFDGLVYVGETGRGVRGRVRALTSGLFEGEMPYRDPHTASPCLWAIVDRYGPNLEVSAATPPAARNKQQRKAMEDALIALHRRERDESPVANFARILPGYEQSSYRKDGFTGGRLPDGKTEPNTEPGISPLPWDQPEELTSQHWMGLEWTPPDRLGNAYGLPPEPGLYRVWNPDSVPPLEYVGETADLKSRLYRHRRSREDSLIYSYVELPSLDARHKREEAETDLLGAHWLAARESPRDQY